MASKKPTLEDWRGLYKAAEEFKEIESWDWMLDSDLFGVQNPENGEVGYCCILGAWGEMFALAVYLGEEGLRGYLKIQSQEVPMDTLDAIHIQKCLMASFEDRRYLTKADLEVIKRLGLKFRGHNSWPLFRNYSPGYYPWYLTREEVRYLTLALEQAKDVCLRFLDNEDLLTPPKGNQLLVRVPVKDASGLSWKDEWMELKPIEEKEVVLPPIDEVRLKRIEKVAPHQPMTWEVDFSYSPEPVRDKRGERPFYPYLSIWIDQDSRFILDVFLLKGSELPSQFAEECIKLLERAKSLPTEIQVEKEMVFHLLKPIASGLGIKLQLVKKLTAMEETRESLKELFPRFDS